jgi:CubicO group peptidase (beta-lactamase class C family)
MDPDKYQQAWQAHTTQTRVTIDADLLSKEVQRSHRDFRSTIFWRDVREVGVSLLLIPIWFVLGFTISLPWTWYLTVPALIWVAGFLLVDRRRHPQRPSEPGEPLLHYVKESLTQLEHQIWLLRNVFWWYLLPPSISIMAFFVHVAWQSSDVWWEFLVVVGFLGLFLFVIYGAVYRLNQSAVREQLEPRRQDLLKLVASLEDETSSEDSHDIFDLVAGLTEPAQGYSWAQNWNLFIPSWREATAITLATLGGAFCGLVSPIDDLGPVFFQSVVGAVIAFEIALAYAWLRSRKKLKSSPPCGELKAPASDVDPENSANQKQSLLPRAPALWIIFLILFLSFMAVFVLYRFVGDAPFRGELPRGPGLDDVSAFKDDDLTYLDTWLRKMADVYPSLSVAIVRDDEIVYLRSFGFEDIEASRQATPQTQYHVASVTKAFTASLAVILHDRGVIDLDQPAVKYLPDDVSISTTPELGATITLRQLASHTSGLPRRVPGRVQSVEGWYELEPQRLYDHLANVKLASDPGAAEEYSNLGFGLLGHALERAADKRFDRLMREMVCDPLMLERTAIQADDTLHVVTGYDRGTVVGNRMDRSIRQIEKHSFKERLAASGGLVTSVEDLAKFLAAQMKPGVFSSEMLDQLHTETKLSNGSASGTALGWSVRSRESVGRILKKNGGRSNCSAWIGFAPDHGVGVAIVSNCGGPDVDAIGYELLERSVPPSRKELVTKDGYAKVAPYTGVRWENDRPIVRVRDKWSRLVSIDGIPIGRIMKFANEEYGAKARKRLAEDLVRLLSEMGHEPKWKVTLGLKSQDGQVEELQILMTEANRDLVWEQQQAQRYP